MYYTISVQQQNRIYSMQYIIGIIIGVLVVKYWTDIQPYMISVLEWFLTLIKAGG